MDVRWASRDIAKWKATGPGWQMRMARTIESAKVTSFYRH